MVVVMQLLLISILFKSTFATTIIHNYDHAVLGDDDTEVLSTILDQSNSLNGKISVNNFTYYNLAVISNLSPDGERFKLLGTYDSRQELEVSGGPEVDHANCLAQLEQLEARLVQRSRQGDESKDLNLELLLDTWGRRPSGLYLGQYNWPGLYSQCKRRKITTPTGRVATRYCWASFQPPNWPQEERHHIRVGVCLPEPCDSVSHKNKYQLIEKLVKSINSNHLDGFNLVHLYCLPDEQSPLRTWWLVPKTLIFTSILVGWLSLIIYSTFTDRFQSLSIKNNFNTLFSMNRQQEKRLVDLNILNGMKAIAAIFFIMGHTTLYLGSQVTNLGEQSGAIHFAGSKFPIVSAWCVDVFITVTGILVGYLSFSKGPSSVPLASRPKLWFALVWNRYMRVMPYYLLAVAYAKYLAKYTGSGPFWDYGTSAASLRRKCEEESWLRTLFYGNIWRSEPFVSCVPSSWYLANDFLFFLVTPLLLQLLHWRPKLGQLTLLAGTLISCLAHSVALFNFDADPRPMARVETYAAKQIFTSLSTIYTRAFYRSSGHFVGLLVGFKLSQLERRTKEEKGKECKIPMFLADYGLKLCVLFSLLIYLFPWLVDLVGMNENIGLSRFMMAFMHPVGHMAYSAIIGVIALLASTGHTSESLKSFLSAPLWRPLAKLGLLIVLTNDEVIYYYFQTSEQHTYISYKSVASIYLSTILIIYSLTSILHLLFEAPMVSLVSRLLFKRTNHQSSVARIATFENSKIDVSK